MPTKIKNKKEGNMRIVTVSVPEALLETIHRLLGVEGIYPSRSELIRCAVRELLLKELKRLKREAQQQEDAKPAKPKKKKKEEDDSGYVKVPVVGRDTNGNAVRTFKTFKILQRLD